MGICEILTIIFVLCKIFEVGAVATWSWWLVLSPEIVAMVVYAICIIRFKLFWDRF